MLSRHVSEHMLRVQSTWHRVFCIVSTGTETTLALKNIAMMSIFASMRWTDGSKAINRLPTLPDIADQVNDSAELEELRKNEPPWRECYGQDSLSQSGCLSCGGFCRGGFTN